jgi:hypothetical protein
LVSRADEVYALSSGVDVDFIDGPCTVSVGQIVVVKVNSQCAICRRLGDCACEGGFGDLFGVLSCLDFMARWGLFRVLDIMNFLPRELKEL